MFQYMNERWVRLFAFAALLASGQNLLADDAKKTTWVSGRVVSISVNAHGVDEKKAKKSARTNDLWWNYCIASKKGAFSVLSRETPAKSGLKENSLIQFMETKNQIYVAGRAGKRIALKILRKSDRCP